MKALNLWSVIVLALSPVAVRADAAQSQLKCQLAAIEKAKSLEPSGEAASSIAAVASETAKCGIFYFEVKYADDGGPRAAAAAKVDAYQAALTAVVELRASKNNAKRR